VADTHDQPDRRHWQIGMRTLFLVVFAIAVWMTYLVNRRHNAWLQQRIANMRPLARELIVDDETKIAVVKLDELWMDDNRWEIYLPPGQYRLCLATRGIQDKGLVPPVKTARVAPGRHSLSIVQTEYKSGWRVTVNLDGSDQIVVDEPKEWDAGHGSSDSGGYSTSTQLAADEPAVFVRRTFMRPNPRGGYSTSGGPVEGLLLWVERVRGSAAAR
jgi:hypothetical protein